MRTLEELEALRRQYEDEAKPLRQQRDDLDKKVRYLMDMAHAAQREIDNLKSDIKIGDLVEWEVGGRISYRGATCPSRSEVRKLRGRVLEIRGQRSDHHDEREFIVRNVRADGTEGAISKLNRWGFGPVPKKVEVA